MIKQILYCIVLVGPITNLDRATTTLAAVLNRDSGLLRVIEAMSPSEDEGNAPIRAIAARVASSQSWNPPSRSSKYFFW